MHDAPFQFAGAHACTINITCTADWYKTICHFRFNVHTVPFKFTCATSLWDVAPTRIFSPSGPGATKLLATRRNMRLKPSEILLWRVWGILSLCHGWKCWMGVLLFCEFLAGRISCSSIQSWWSLPFLQMSQVLASEDFLQLGLFFTWLETTPDFPFSHVSELVFEVQSWDIFWNCLPPTLCELSDEWFISSFHSASGLDTTKSQMWRGGRSCSFNRSSLKTQLQSLLSNWALVCSCRSNMFELFPQQGVRHGRKVLRSHIEELPSRFCLQQLLLF